MPTQTSSHTPASPKRRQGCIGLYFVITASLLLGLAIYVAGMTWLYFKQEGMLFKPVPLAGL